MMECRRVVPLYPMRSPQQNGFAVLVQNSLQTVFINATELHSALPSAVSSLRIPQEMPARMKRMHINRLVRFVQLAALTTAITLHADTDRPPDEIGPNSRAWII